MQAMLTSLTAGSSAAAAIVYLANKGNAKANWFAMCQQHNTFCERISESLIDWILHWNCAVHNADPLVCFGSFWTLNKSLYYYYY
ncbi:Casparian strip membrane protein 3 [Spatholobus suberectus]|nr:Casparian strip membrane protein 3 [Spatholobus suberectus]